MTKNAQKIRQIVEYLFTSVEFLLAYGTLKALYMEDFITSTPHQIVSIQRNITTRTACSKASIRNPNMKNMRWNDKA